MSSYIAISKLAVGENISQVFYLKKVHIGKTPKKQIPYVGLVLSDISGEIRIILWEQTSTPLQSDTYVKISGTVTDYNGEKQINTSPMAIMTVSAPTSTEEYVKNALDSLTINRLLKELDALLPANKDFCKLLIDGKKISEMKLSDKHLDYGGSLLEQLVLVLRNVDSHHKNNNDQILTYNANLIKNGVIIYYLCEDPLEIVGPTSIELIRCAIDIKNGMDNHLVYPSTKESLIAVSLIRLVKNLSIYNSLLKFTQKNMLGGVEIRKC